MGLVELIGEWISPGPVGSVDIAGPASRRRPTWMIIAHVGIAAVGLSLLLAYIGIPHGIGGTLACLAYVLAGTVLKPRPDVSNLGWLGGLMDHPFRFSDDINRFLVFLLIFLWPGGVIGGGFLELIRWFIAASTRTVDRPSP